MTEKNNFNNGGKKNPSWSQQKDRLHWDYQGKMTIQSYSSLTQLK